MGNLAGSVASTLAGLFTDPVGADFQLDSVAQSLAAVPSIPLKSVITGNASPELIEQSLALQYPTVVVYCEKLNNTLKEKFRVFSGTALAIVEVRHTQDQIQNMQETLEVYIAAACQVLDSNDSNRGDWGNGLFYRGGYQVNFGPVKRGGRNFLQIARITVEVDVSA
jgi:hypothetical protein